MESLTPRQIRSNRIKLLILWLVPIGLMGIAAVCFYLVQTGRMSIGSTNHGSLVNPPLQLLELASEQSLVAEQAFSTHQKWTMLIRGDVQCDETCRDALYLTRQIHVRLDKSANRVQRVLLVEALPLDEDAAAYIEQEHKYLKLAVLTEPALVEIEEAVRREDGELPIFMLVDQDGWLMMAYYQHHEGNGMLKDIKHLLKITRER